MIIEPVLTVLSLHETDLKAVLAIIQKFHLDYDDAYQYITTIQNNLTLVSFDKDFDKTDLRRKTPGEILKG